MVRGRRAGAGSQRARRWRWARRDLAARVAVAMLLAMALVCATMRAGSTYFFCSAMQEARSEPCCQRPPPAASPQVDDADCGCCRAHHLGRLPTGLAGEPSARAVSAATPIALLAALDSAAPVRRSWDHPLVQRWTRPPRAAPPMATDLVRLQVSLT